MTTDEMLQQILKGQQETNRRLENLRPVFEAVDSRLRGLEESVEAVAVAATQSRESGHRLISILTAIGVFQDQLVEVLSHHLEEKEKLTLRELRDKMHQEIKLALQG